MVYNMVIYISIYAEIFGYAEYFQEQKKYE